MQSTATLISMITSILIAGKKLIISCDSLTNDEIEPGKRRTSGDTPPRVGVFFRPETSDWTWSSSNLSNQTLATGTALFERGMRGVYWPHLHSQLVFIPSKLLPVDTQIMWRIWLDREVFQHTGFRSEGGTLWLHLRERHLYNCRKMCHSLYSTLQPEQS